MRVQTQLLLSAYYAAKASNSEKGSEPSLAQVGGAAQLRPVSYKIRMSPIELLKYVTDYLQGTVYEPWVNCLLFLLFTVAVIKAVMLLLGKMGRAYLLTIASKTVGKATELQEYAPELEHIRKRVDPYVRLAGFLYFALVGLYAAAATALVGMVLAIEQTAPWVLCISVVLFLASLYYFRVCLANATWVYHEIKNQGS